MKNLLLILSVCIGMQASAAWIQRASLGNEGRHRASAIGLGNFGYVGLGHYNGFGSEYYFNDWWQYDPASNSWSQKADYPGFFGQGNCGCHSWTFEGKIYVGLGENQPTGLYRYDPLTNTWQQMTSAPAGTVFQDTHEMVINNKAYFMNLTGGAGLYEYDCGSDSWSNIGTVNIPLGFTYSAYTYDDRCWIKADTTMYMYEPSTNLWYWVISAGGFPGEAIRGSAEFFIDSTFYILGGHGQAFGDVTNEVWAFDPVNYQWAQQDPFPGSARRFSEAFVINGTAYVCSGTNGTNFNDLWEFDPLLNNDELTNPNSFSFYPNPVSQSIHLNNDSIYEEAIIKDLNGKIVKRFNEKEVDLSELNSGTYFIQLIMNDGRVSLPEQLIKK